MTTGTLALNAALTATGAVTVTNAGQADVSAPITAGGTVWIKGPGTVNLGADVTVTNAGDFDLFAPLVLTEDVAISSATGTGSVYFRSTVDSSAGVPGCRLLTIAANADTGTVSFADAVGSAAPLGGVIILSASHGDFAGAVTACGAGIDVTTETAHFGGPVATTEGGAVVVTNSGAVTIALSAPFSLDGAFTQVGPGPVTIAGSITTTADPITFTGAVTLSGPVTLDTGDGGGDIGFGAAIGGAHGLTIDAGTGAVGFGGAVGSPAKLTGLDVTGGDIAFIGPVQTMSGGAVSIQNSGILDIGAAAAMTLDGPFTQSGGGTAHLGASIVTTGDAITFSGTTTLVGDITLTSAGGAITFFGIATDAAGTGSLIVDAGSGAVTFSGAVGSAAVPIGLLRVDRAGAITVNGNASMWTAGVIDFNAYDSIHIGAPMWGAGGIALRAGTGATETGAIVVEVQDPNYALKASDEGADIVLYAGDATGDVTLSGNVLAVDRVTVSAPGGAIAQYAGVLSGAAVGLEAAGAITGLDGEHQEVFLATSTALIDAQSFGAGNLMIRNVPWGAAGDLEIGSMATLGGDIWLEQYYRETGGTATVTGNVTSGSQDAAVDGGSITISSANGLVIQAEISTRGGTGGTFDSVGDVDVTLATISVGAGDIVLLGNATSDLLVVDLSGGVRQADAIYYEHTGDIIIKTILETTVLGSDITLIADSDGDGRGGVIVEAAGFLKSGGNIVISGSDCIATAESTDSVVIANDGALNQLEAAGGILIESGNAAPEAAIVQIEGKILATGTAGIFIYTFGETLTGTTIAARGGDVEFAGPVVLSDATTVTTENPGGDEGTVFFCGAVTGTGALSVYTGAGSTVFEDVLGAEGAYPASLYVETTDLTLHSAVNVDGPISLIVAGEPVLGPFVATVGRGDIMIRAPACVTLPVLRAADGKIDVEAGDTITAHDILSQAGSAANAVQMMSLSGNILLGVVDGGAYGLVTLRALQGVVADDSEGEEFNIRAGSLVVEAMAAGVLPGLDDLDIAVGRLNVTTAGILGNVALAQTASAGDLVVEAIHVTGQNNPGSVYLVSEGGAITVAQTGSGIAVDGPGHVLIETIGADYDVTLNAAVTLAGGSLSVRAGGDGALGAAVSVTVADTSTVQFEALTGGITMAGDACIAAQSGNIHLQAAGDILVSSIETTGDVSIYSISGSVLGAGAFPVHVAAEGLALRAGSGIGVLGEGSAPFRMSVDDVAALSGPGGINLVETDGLQVTSVPAVVVNAIYRDGGGGAPGRRGIPVGIDRVGSGRHCTEKSHRRHPHTQGGCRRRRWQRAPPHRGRRLPYCNNERRYLRQRQHFDAVGRRRLPGRHRG